MTPSIEATGINPVKARPFLKWAGGKSQLLEAIRARLPEGIGLGKMTRYAEPFVGSGAVFFDLSHRFSFSECLLMDANDDLTRAYQVLQSFPEMLIKALTAMANEYRALSNEDRRAYFYMVRRAFNEPWQDSGCDAFGPDAVARTARLIFLNRTCFNGLYRVNSRGRFNVPFGRYDNPTICNAANLRLVSRALQGVEIRTGDFESCADFIDAHTFVYFDPPYRPLSKTAHFTSYAAHTFDDASQLRLARFFRKLDQRGAKLMLSNSDPKNENPEDDFFDRAYEGFRIERVKAARAINSNARLRGPVNELIITNY